MKEKNMRNKSLLEKISNFTNLCLAFNECGKGKRASMGFQESLFAYGEQLKQIEKKLLRGTFTWNGYRSFYVHDPKTRKVMSAPFMDRVVHHAIHRQIDPIIDPLMSDCVFACRKSRGNRHAALYLLRALETLGQDRFAIKLDVKQYFHSINHDILLDRLMKELPDQTLKPLIFNLLKSHFDFSTSGCGIPIGNLTSQLFANFYLRSADEVAIKTLDIDYYWQQASDKKFDSYYIRYMDDAVLVGKSKSQVLDAAENMVHHVENELRLKIPLSKKVPLGNAPIPFMGYVLDHTGFRILSRNNRRFCKSIKRLNKHKMRPSYIAQVETSFLAWKNLRGKVS